YARDHDARPVEVAPPVPRFALPPYTVRELRAAARRPRPTLTRPPAPPAEPELESAAAAGWLQRLGHWFRRPAPDASPDNRDPDPARAVAAYVVWAAAEAAPASSLAPTLGRVQRLLEEQESALPVRAAWLAHVALARLSGGDVIGLARARDRLLERLYQHGLSLDLDVPAFLRFAGQGSGDWASRAQEVRDWLSHARESVHRWVAARPDRPVGRA